MWSICGWGGEHLCFSKPGTYRIVINPFNNTTGAYRMPTM
jgi:hypothetical protein